MPHLFREWDHEPEPQPSGSRRGKPPRKRIGIAVLDPGDDPRRESNRSEPIPTALIVRVVATTILVGLVTAALLALLAPILKF